MKQNTGRNADHADYALVVFAYSWACAELFHRICFARFTTFVEWLSVPILAAALVTLFHPRSLAALAVLCTLSALHTILKVPVANHMTFGGVANLAIVLVLIRHRLRDRSAIWAELSAALRIFIYLLYFFAVLHKLNADYLGSSGSCGAHFWDAMRERLPFLPGGAGARQFAVYGSLAAEILIPVFLIIRRLRALGILFGFAFHALLLTADNGSFCLYSFSSLVIASYVVFLDPAAWGRAKSRLYRLEGFVESRIPGFGTFRTHAFAVFGSLAFACLVSFLFFMKAGHESRYYEESYTRLGLTAWALYAFGVVVFFAAALAGSRPAGLAETGPRPRRPWPMLFGAAILIFYGLNPYVGLRTMPCFAMFSNLRTEGAWNHLFMPKSMKIFPYQEDLVEVLSSSDPYLQDLADQKKLVPYLDVERVLSQTRQPVSVEYIRDGERHVFEGIAPRSGNPLADWFFRKFMRFRAVPKEGSMPCVH